jgi:glycerol kinase
VNVLAIDQGTSATKALVLGPGNEVLGSAEEPVHPRSTADGGVEQEPEELYRSVVGAGTAALAQARAPVQAMALANQGETVLAWDRRSGRALTPAIVWQDRRSSGVCQRLSASAGRLAAITGLPLDPYFAAPKMTWLRENLTAEGAVTTTDTWLLARLRADGGLTRSRLLVQAQADLLQAPVEVSKAHDATALGVAALARLGAGDHADLAGAVGPAEVEWVAEPAITADQAAERLAAYDLAVRAVLAPGAPSR